MGQDILEEKAKQVWDAGKVTIRVGYTIVATVHHSGGNGLNQSDAVNVAKQMVKGWNALIETQVSPEQETVTKPCVDCGDRGWIYNERAERIGTCHCHY